jgi:hypothetical protein
MEKIFRTLGHPLRLWIVMHLAANGPTAQVAIGTALKESEIPGGDISPGALTNLMRPLLEAGVLARDRPRGPLYLQHDEQIRRLLATASALTVATTSETSDVAHRRHSELMRAISTAVNTRADAPEPT